MNKGLLIVAVLVAVIATLLLQAYLGGFIAFVPLMALALLAIFWGLRRSAA